MSVVIPKGQFYQMWAADGTYLGVLQGVRSKFKRVQDINTVGPSTIEVDVAMNTDTPYMPVKAILTEDGLWITTESGVGLLTEGEQPNYGVDKTKIRNGNTVRITEVSDYYPNGKVVFNGRVKKWNVNFGTDDDAKLYVEVSSSDTNNHLVKSGPVASITQLSGPTGIFIQGSPQVGRYGYAFDFATAGVTNLSSVTLLLGAVTTTPVPVTLSIVDLGPSNTGGSFNANSFDSPALTSTTVSVTTGSPTLNSAEYVFTFPTPYYFDTSRYYGLLVSSTAAAGVQPYVFESSSDVNPNGAIYYNNGDGSGWKFGTGGSDAAYDMYFRFFTIPPYTKSTITNFEPSALLKTIINNYNAEGGVVTYTGGSIQTTGITIASYTFQSNTVAEGLDIILALSPPGFYYTIDPGTNVITFKKINAIPDHIIKFKTHIKNLDLSASIENLHNTILFTGGLVSGTNIYVQRSNAASIAVFGTQLDRENDVNVTNTSTAGQIAQNYLDKEVGEVYETALTLIDGQTDINTYQLGETCGFEGFGTFADSVIIPIVRISKDMDTLDASLGSLPVRQATIIQDTSDSVQALTTVANPQQPS